MAILVGTNWPAALTMANGSVRFWGELGNDFEGDAPLQQARIDVKSEDMGTRGGGSSTNRAQRFLRLVQLW